MRRSGRIASPEMYHTNTPTSVPVARQIATVSLSIRIVNMPLAFKSLIPLFIRMLNPLAFKTPILPVPVETSQLHDL
jgi:hypothetical protein